MSYIESLEQRAGYIKAQINCLEKKIAKLPPGKLACYGPAEQTQWFLLTGPKGDPPKYIKKSERAYAERLYQKGGHLATIADLEAELAIIEDFLGKYSQLTKPAGSNYYGQPCYAEFQNKAQHATDEQVSKFLSQVYEGADHPENRKYKCKNGLMVRSKSENLIADALYAKGIPFLYEYPHAVRDRDRVVHIHPDFTILDTNTMTLKIWEHFGLMVDESYQFTVSKKIRQLASIGYYPDENLIMTFESPNHMLSSAEVEEKVIQNF